MYRINENIITNGEVFYFTKEHIYLAHLLKSSGVDWKPAAGCYIWDENDLIFTESPFPDNIYYILDVDFFNREFGSLENFASKVVWLPTYLETLSLCRKRNITLEYMQEWGVNIVNGEPAEELIKLYRILLNSMNNNDDDYCDKKMKFKDELSKYHFIHYY